MLDKELENQMLKQSLMIAIVDENGKLMWITTGKPTKQQQTQFQRIQIVTDRPSFVLLAIVFIDLTILRLIHLIERFLKGKDE